MKHHRVYHDHIFQLNSVISLIAGLFTSIEFSLVHLFTSSSLKKSTAERADLNTLLVN